MNSMMDKLSTFFLGEIRISRKNLVLKLWLIKVYYFIQGP
jgi:hypothetical protein